MRNLRLLIWLKWKLNLRGYQRNTSMVFSAVLLLIVFVLIALPLGVICGMGFVALKTGNDTHLLKAVLLGTYVLWLLSPLLGYALNDTYDITKLFVYPLSVKQIFVGAVCGSLLDITSLLMLPTFAAALYGFSLDFGALLLNAIAIGLLIFHTLSLSQATILLSAGFLRSRRFRDSIGIIFVVMGTLYFVLQMSLAMHPTSLHLDTLLTSNFWDKINYLPPGLAARSLEAAKHGNFSDSIAYLVILSVITGVTLYLAAVVVQKVYTGSGESGGAEPAVRQKQKARDEKAGWGRLERFLPPAVLAIMEKETKYLFRDPYFRMVLSNFLYLTVVTIFMSVTMRRLTESQPSGMNFPLNSPQTGPLGSTLIMMMQLSLICNFFGTEGGAITQLFLAPCPRRQIVLGKNFALFLSLSAVNLIYVTIATVAAGNYAGMAKSYLWLEILLVLFMGLGNFASIYAPFRLVMKGWRVKQQSAAKGCAYTLLYFLVMLIAAVLALPVAAAFFVPGEFIGAEWFALTLPLAMLYALCLYGLSLYFAPDLLAQREEQINLKVSQEES